MKENGKEIAELKKPTTPDIKPKNIVRGINGRISKFTGKDKMERFPILYKIRGKTKSCVAITETTSSRNWNFVVINLKYL